MWSTLELGRSVWDGIRYHRRPLLAFHIYFSILLVTTLAPAAAWLLGGLISLTGEPMIGNEDLIAFLLTPQGMAWLLLFGALGAGFLYVEHAGMMLVATPDASGRYATAITSVWRILFRLPRILKLAMLQVAAHLLLAAPALGMVSVAYVWLLGDYDLYFVLREQPTAYWQFLLLLSVLTPIMFSLHAWLYVRWVLALPVLLFESRSVRETLTTSTQLTRGRRWRIAWKVLAVAALIPLLPVIVSLLLDVSGGLLLRWMPAHYGLLAGVIGGLLAVFALLAVLVGFATISANSLLILRLYQRCVGQEVALDAEQPPRRTGLFAWTLEAMLVVLVVGQVYLAVQWVELPEPPQVSAHRGSSWDAPENSLSAISLALAQGADYVELDVRQTADGELVLLHDRDLRRIAGVASDIWTMDYSDVRELDAGSWFASEFAGERIATLSEAIALVRGQARLYLEIKPSPMTPDITRRVVETLQAEDFVADTTLAAMSPSILHEALALEPQLRTSLLVHTAIGDLLAQPFDALAFRDALVDRQRLQRLRRVDLEVHVWTVNDPREMARFIDLGVDNIITDRPDVLRELLDERAALTDGERLLLTLRNWLW